MKPHVQAQREYRERNLDAVRAGNAAHMRRWRKANPARWLYILAQSRARKRGLPFDITVEDVVVPTHCPVLGIPLELGPANSPGLPSLDRIRPADGYVRGNVRVISFRANALKRDATVEEMRRVLRYMEAN